jgi:hypothetical protein
VSRHDYIQILTSTWQMEADLQRRRGQEQDAIRTESFIEDVLEARARHLGQLMTLQEGAEECGYSKAHLGRMVRNGSISNAGKKHAPRVLRRDLPTKLALSPPQPVSDLSSEQIVRSVTKLGEG